MPGKTGVLEVCSDLSPGLEVLRRNEVWSGFSEIKLQAPSEPGTYRLFEVVESGNTHAGWRWEKE